MKLHSQYIGRALRPQSKRSRAWQKMKDWFKHPLDKDGSKGFESWHYSPDGKTLYMTTKTGNIFKYAVAIPRDHSTATYIGELK